jgi:hypothetical protein
MITLSFLCNELT